MSETTKQLIEAGRTALGIEFGSTRIKAVLVDENNAPVASGGHEWENRLENGIWTYTLEDIISGLQDCYRKMAEDVKQKYGVTLTKIGAIGISAMMHGYMVFDKADNLLVAEQQRGICRRPAYRAVRLSYPRALVGCASVPGDLKRRRAR